VQRFYEILEDTLLAHRLDAFAKSERRRLVQHPRHFFFDVGVYNALVGNFEASDDRIGALFEHLLLSQIVATAQSRDVDLRVSTYRTEHGAEVDFIVEIGREVWAIEAKASRNVGPMDARGLRSFAEYFGKKHRTILAYRGDHARRMEGVDVLPWRRVVDQIR
jgi:predicted AAA+ superfamily ATPase